MSIPRQFVLLLGIIFGLIATLCADTGQSSKEKDSQSIVPGCVFVKFRSADDPRRGSKAPETVLAGTFRKHGVDFELSGLWREGYTARLRQLRSQRNVDTTTIENTLRTLHVCTFSEDLSPRQIAGEIGKLPEVVYCEPRFRRTTSLIPDDTLYGETGQDYFEYQGFPLAWDVTQGSTDVVIAIVDSGVDYTHPDLAEKIWTNEDEISGNGIDDDGNGYIDDVIGWDFWQSGPADSRAVSDNDPKGEYSDHGTHVAGIAAADTNNGLGIAGTGFNCRYMAVKAGGTQSYPDEIAFGIEGVLYAAMNGARVINCSWGGEDYSATEEEIINQATDLGALIVCAAGNDDTDTPIYPAGYARTVAVGSVDMGTSERSYFSNYGSWIDVMATGSSLKSTSFNGTYVVKSGTSMSTPVVSGLAGLLFSLHTNWQPERVRTQIRGTAEDIEADNPAYFQNKLGLGSVRADRAVSADLPSFSATVTSFLKADGTAPFAGGFAVLTLSLNNAGSAVSRASFELTSMTSGIIVRTGQIEESDVAAGSSIDLTFDVEISDIFEVTTVPEFMLTMSNEEGTYRDRVLLEANTIIAADVAVNKINMTLTTAGSLGFIDALEGEGGIGFVTNADSDTPHSILFEGGLIIDLDGLIVDRVRETSDLSRDFTPSSGFTMALPGAVSAADGSGTFDVSEVAGAPPVTIELQSYAFTTPEVDQSLFLEYTLTNHAQYPVNNVYVGLFNDWDIGTVSLNATGYDSDGAFLYTYDAGSTSMPYVAVVPVAAVSSQLSIDNANTAGQNEFDFGIYYTSGDPQKDGFSDTEKALSLRAGLQNTTHSETDTSTVNASGPFSIAPAGTIVAGFIYAYGDSLDDLRTQVAAARACVPFTASEAATEQTVNQPPALERTLPREDLIVLDGTDSQLVLETSIQDDGLPEGSTPELQWSLQEGPAEVIFEHITDGVDIAAFSQSGVYVLAATVSDGLRWASDELTVIVSGTDAFSQGWQAGWNFEEEVEGVYPDISGNGRTATPQGNATLTQNGYDGRGIELNGTTASAAFDAPSLSQFTIAAWVYSDSRGNSVFPRIVDMPAYIFYAGRDSSTDDSNRTLRFYASRTDDDDGVWYTAPGTIKDGTWMHVAVSYDADDPETPPVFYLNGEALDTLTLTEPRGDQAVDNAGSGYIGSNSGSTRSWDGRMDDVHIFNRVLTETEVRALAGLSGANCSPTVNAGPDQEVMLPNTVLLQGTVEDDGRPTTPGTVSIQWSKLSGPGEVSFGSPTSAETEAGFSIAGTYELELRADDGDVVISDRVTVTASFVPTISVAPTQGTSVEGDPAQSIDIVLDAPSGEEIVVGITATGGTAGLLTDYLITPEEVTFPAGATSRTVTLTVIDDNIPSEGNETAILELSTNGNAYLGAATCTYTIQDNDFLFTLNSEHAPVTELQFGRVTGADDEAPDALDVLYNGEPASGQGELFFKNTDMLSGDPVRLSSDIGSTEKTDSIWRLIVTIPDGSDPIVISWNFNGLLSTPEQGIFLQENLNERPVGSPIDMLAVQTWTFSYSGEYAIVFGNTVSDLQITGLNGWNLLGIPVLTTTPFRTLLPGLESDTSCPTVWTWNRGAYEPVDITLPPNPERGYWIHLSAGSGTAYSGVHDDGIMTLSEGWELVSPTRETTVPVNLPAGALIYAWDTETSTYSECTPGTPLIPGKAYWFFCPDDTTELDLGTGE